MPTYVYACDACGKRFEQFQSFKDEPLSVCHCGVEGKVRRVIQPAGIVFKGSGWYITDSKGAGSSAVGDSPRADTAEKSAANSAATSEKSTTSESSPSSSDD